jgi:hypothetical protein
MRDKNRAFRARGNAARQEIDPLVAHGFKLDRAMVGAVAVQKSGGAGEDAEGDENKGSNHGRETFLSSGPVVQFFKGLQRKRGES